MQQEFINEQVSKICKTYKISEEDAANFVEEKIGQDKEISNILQTNDTLKNVYKTRIVKNFIKKLKKEIYFNLRTYQKQDSSLVNSHISTKERQNYLSDFLNQLDDVLLSAKVILDLGGGMFPASFPFEKYPNVEKYIWLDKDTQSYTKLEKFKQQHGLGALKLVNSKIGETSWEGLLGDEIPDLVFMIKLIPVISRQERALLDFLAKVPAKNILITGSKEGMVKKIDISARENKVLLSFIAKTGKSMIKKVNIENEFGYLVS